MSTYVLLDVDGVAPIRPEHPAAWPPRDEEMNELTGAPGELPILAGLGSWLKSLPAQVIWVTTWEDAANEAVGPRLGLPILPVLHLPRATDGRWAKAVAVREWVVGATPQPRQVVWIDDHTRRFSEDVAWALDPLDGEALVLTPGPHRGIDKADMRAVSGFLGV